MINKVIKRFVSFLLVISLVAALVLQNDFTQEIEAADAAWKGEVGDANQDGEVNVVDLIILKKNAEVTEERYDLDNNGTCNEEDVDLIRRFLVGEICSFYRPDTSAANNDSYLYAGTDGLDRELTLAGAEMEEKAVGIRYFLHLGVEGSNPLYSVSAILGKNATAFNSSGAWEAAGGGAVGTKHWWGESLFGYYISLDKWVLERDVQMLTDAGIDFIAIDTAENGVYVQQLTLLLQVLDKYYQQGFEVPKVTFTVSNEEIAAALQSFYDDSNYSHLWYKQGDTPVKSMEELTVTTVRAATSVENTAMSESAFYGEMTNHQRTWDGVSNSTAEGALAEGLNFAYEFEAAIEKNPAIIYVESWNEWIAEREDSSNTSKPIVFKENADINNSSDIQPMKDGYGDNYYMQLVDYIQQFKGSKVTNRKLNTVASTEGMTIDINGDFSQWNKVNTHYLDYTGEIEDRVNYENGYGQATDNHVAKITINSINEAAPMSFITKQAYPAGSTISFEAYVPESASWWAVGWTKSATEANDVNNGIYNGLYAHTKTYNEHKLGQAMSSAKGNWADYSVTLPSDGDYYVYIVGAKGEWKDDTGSLSLLIDDFKVTSKTGEVFSDDFETSPYDGLFNMRAGVSLTTSRSTVTPIDYTDSTGRNDISKMKMTTDGTNLYCLVETEGQIQGFGEPNCMSLFISTGNVGGCYNQYEYVVNRDSSEATKMQLVVEKYSGGKWVVAGNANYRMEGNKLQMAIPLAVLNCDSAFSLEFKWADNYDENDFYSFYTKGDAAPYGRLNYVYEVRDYAAAVTIDWLNESVPMNFITEQAYPAGSTISFEAYVPEGASWWSVCWTTSATEANDLSKGIYNNLYAHTKKYNGNSLGKAMTSKKGEWANYSVTLPNDGNEYYVFIGGDKNNWKDTSGNKLSLLIDNVTVTSNGTVIAKETFNGGFAHGLFNIVEEATNGQTAVSLVSREITVAEQAASITIGNLVTKCPQFFLTKDKYPAGSTVTFRAYVPEGASWYSVCWTTNITETPDPAKGETNSIYAHGTSFGNYKLGQSMFSQMQKGVWADYSVTLPDNGYEYYIYIAGPSGEWKDSDGNPVSLLIDDLKIRNASGELIAKDNFNEGFENGLFSVTEKNGSNTVVSLEAVSTVQESSSAVSFTAYAAPYAKKKLNDSIVPDLDQIDAAYQKLAEAGFNKAIELYAGYTNASEATADNLYEIIKERSSTVEDLAVDILNIAEKYDVQYYVKDWSFYGLGRKHAGSDPSVITSALVSGEKQFQTIFSEMFRAGNPYIRHNAYAGNFGYDEPWMDELEVVAWQAKYYKETMEENDIRNGEVLVNLLPAYVYDGSAQFGGSGGTYEAYIDKYLTEIAQPYLGYVCWDFYPFMNNNTIREKYLYNYELVANKCKGKYVELRTFIQAKGDNTYTRNLYNIGELRYQIYSGMAFGVKEFVYFTYSGTNAIYDSATQTYTNVYDYAKQVNNEVHYMEKVYSQYEWNSVMYKLAEGSTENALLNNLQTTQTSGVCDGLTISTCTKDTLVGIFKAKDSNSWRPNAYMLVNEVDPSGESELTNTVTVTFGNDVTSVAVWQSGNKEIIPISAHQHTFTLSSGEGVFVIPLK